MEPTAVGALIASGSALAGVAISRAFDVFASWVDRRHALLALRRTKFEELADFLNKSVAEFAAITTSKSIDDLALSKSPIYARKVLMLAQVYFPRLREEAAAYANSCVEVQALLIEMHIEAGIPSAAQAVRRDLEGYKKVCGAMWKARQDLEESIELEARRYFPS